MRGVATLDDFAHEGTCALSNAGARRAIIIIIIIINNNIGEHTI